MWLVIQRALVSIAQLNNIRSLHAQSEKERPLLAHGDISPHRRIWSLSGIADIEQAAPINPNL
jgi:hypothetical protein